MRCPHTTRDEDSARCSLCIGAVCTRTTAPYVDEPRPIHVALHRRGFATNRISNIMISAVLKRMGARA
jgi:hypothetical protein